MLSLNDDGAVLVMDESIGDGAIYVTGFRGKDGCWERSGFQKDVILEFSSLDAIGVSGDGATVIGGKSRDTSSKASEGTKTTGPAASRCGARPATPRTERLSCGPTADWHLRRDQRGWIPGLRRRAPELRREDQLSPGEPIRHGSAYVLDLKSQGAALATLNADNWIEGAGYGRAIAASADGHHILVGADNERSLDETGTQMSSDATSGSGAVYLFEGDGSTWTQRHMFKPENPKDVSGGAFGRSVAVSDDGNTVVIGARWYKPEMSGGLDSGAIYVFKRGAGDTWTHRVIDGAEYPLTSFATAFALDGSGKLLVVGAPAWSIKEAGAVVSTGPCSLTRCNRAVAAALCQRRWGGAPSARSLRSDASTSSRM